MTTHCDTLFAYELPFEASGLPYIIGCGVAAFVFLFFCTRVWWNRSSLKRTLAAENPDGSKAGYDHEERMFGDRRTTVRRDGQPVRVFLSSPAFKDQTREGFVLDRSTGGIKLGIDTPIAPGTAMRILAVNAPDTTPWVTVIVRSCKPIGKRFDLGCEFETTPPWNILLLFG